jgi:hypothetical protein
MEKQGFIAKSCEVASLAWLRWERNWAWGRGAGGKGLQDGEESVSRCLGNKNTISLETLPTLFVFHLSLRTRPVSQSARRLTRIRSGCTRKGDSNYGAWMGILSTYNQNDYVKEDEIGGTCSTNGIEEERV